MSTAQCTLKYNAITIKHHCCIISIMRQRAQTEREREREHVTVERGMGGDDIGIELDLRIRWSIILTDPRKKSLLNSGTDEQRT